MALKGLYRKVACVRDVNEADAATASGADEKECILRPSFPLERTDGP